MARFRRRPRPLHHPLRLTVAALILSLGAPAVGQQETAAAQEAEEGEEALTILELSSLCRQLRSEDDAERSQAIERIIAAGPSSLNGLRLRLRRDRRASPYAMHELLDELGPDVQGQRLPPQDETPPFDLIPPLLEAPREDEDQQRTIEDALEIVVLLRALTAADTTAASRVMIQHGVRERGAFRAEIARNLLRLGENAIPALLQTTQHPNESVAALAVELLEWLNRSTAGRQVQVRDPNTLAEILSVYGEIADREAIPVLLSFTGSEVAAVRRAARASLRRYGGAILWPARTKYENFTGEEADRRWDWEELTERLFEAQDQARMAQAEQSMAAGLRHAEAGEFEQMMASYEKILGRWPLYERRQEMIPGLIAFADELERQGELERSRRVLAQALLLDPDSEGAGGLEARLAMRSLEHELRRGVATPRSLERLDSLDRSPTLRTEPLQTLIERRTRSASPRSYRMIAAVGLALIAFGLFGLLLLRELSSASGRSRGDGATSEE